MIQNIIGYLDAQLSQTGYFQKIWGLAEFVGEEGNRRPMKYCTNGEYKNVLDIDSKQGTVYIRRNGVESISENDAQNQISCGRLYDITIPLRVVCWVDRKLVTEDDEFATDRASKAVVKYLAQPTGGTLAVDIKAKRVNITPVSINLNPYEVLRGEKQRIDKDLPFKYMLFSIDLSVVVTTRRECIIEECE